MLAVHFPENAWAAQNAFEKWLHLKGSGPLPIYLKNRRVR